MQADTQSTLTNARMMVHRNYKHQHNHLYKQISTFLMAHILKAVYIVVNKERKRDKQEHTTSKTNMDTEKWHN